MLAAFHNAVQYIDSRLKNWVFAPESSGREQIDRDRWKEGLSWFSIDVEEFFCRIVNMNSRVGKQNTICCAE